MPKETKNEVFLELLELYRGNALKIIGEFSVNIQDDNERLEDIIECWSKRFMEAE